MLDPLDFLRRHFDHAKYYIFRLHHVFQVRSRTALFKHWLLPIKERKYANLELNRDMLRWSASR